MSKDTLLQHRLSRLTDPPPDPKSDPEAIDADDAQIEPPEDDAFKKK